MMQKLNLNSPAYNVLSEEDKEIFKLFLTTLFKLGRNTKRILNEVPNIDKLEIPHLSLTDKVNNVYVIEYSITLNKWIVSINDTKPVIFNPTAIKGVIEFLNNFDNDNIKLGIDFYQEGMDEISLKYSIQY